MKKVLISIVVIIGLITIIGKLGVDNDAKNFCFAVVDTVAKEKADGKKSYDVQRNLTTYIQSKFDNQYIAKQYVLMGEDVVRRTYRNNNPMEACK